MRKVKHFGLVDFCNRTYFHVVATFIIVLIYLSSFQHYHIYPISFLLYVFYHFLFAFELKSNKSFPGYSIQNSKICLSYQLYALYQLYSYLYFPAFGPEQLRIRTLLRSHGYNQDQLWVSDKEVVSPTQFPSISALSLICPIGHGSIVTSLGPKANRWQLLFPKVIFLFDCRFVKFL